MSATFFEPRISSDDKEYWDGLKQNKLLVRQCNKCGKITRADRKFCPDCLSDDYKLNEVEPKGTIYSFVVFHKPFHKSFEDKVPYVVATIDLDCGVRILANIINCEPTDVKCAMRVSGIYEPQENYTKLQFELGE